MRLRRDFLNYFGILLGGIILIYQIFRSYHAIIHRFSGDFSTLIFYSALLTLLSLGIQILAWSRIMKGIGTNIILIDAFHGYILSFLPRYIPGTVWGYLSRSEWLFQKHKINRRISNLGSIFEIFSTITANIMLIGISSLKVTSYSRILNILLLIFFIPLVWITLQKVFSSRYIMNLFAETSNGAGVGIKFHHWITGTIFFGVTWILYGVSLLLIIQFLINGKLISAESILEITGIYCIAWLAGFLVFVVPSGLGFRELVLSSLLSNKYNIPLIQATGVAILFRFVLVFMEFVWLVIGITIKPIARFKGVGVEKKK